MRIISGLHKGRRLAAPPGRETRPLLGRIREALFSTLGDWIEDTWVLDLYAGSGSLGLEALSRGAAGVRFIEQNPTALIWLRTNVQEMEFGDTAQVIQGDALDPFLWRATMLDATREHYGVIFLDPPYPLLNEPRGRAFLFERMQELVLQRLTEGGVLIFHAPKRKIFPDDFPASIKATRRDYGSSTLWYLSPAEGYEAPVPEGESKAAEPQHTPTLDLPLPPPPPPEFPLGEAH